MIMHICYIYNIQYIYRHYIRIHYYSSAAAPRRPSGNSRRTTTTVGRRVTTTMVRGNGRKLGRQIMEDDLFWWVKTYLLLLLLVLLLLLLLLPYDFGININSPAMSLGRVGFWLIAIWLRSDWYMIYAVNISAGLEWEDWISIRIGDLYPIFWVEDGPYVYLSIYLL